MRTILKRLLCAALVALCATVALGIEPSAASAEGRRVGASCGDRNGCIRAVAVSGLIDSINVDFVERAVRDSAADSGFKAVVLVVDSPGSVVSDAELRRLVTVLRRSPVPVSAWVGPSGAEALGGAGEMVTALPASMAPRTRIGDFGHLRDLPSAGATAAALRGVIHRVVDEKTATRMHLVQRVDALAGDHALNVAKVKSRVVTNDRGTRQRSILATPVAQKVPVTVQLLHTAASPAVAYLLLGVAIGLLLFEFYTAGIGIAGLVGAVCGVLAAYGLAEIPLRPWALALCLASAVAFAIDIQTAIPRVWTVVGLVCWAVGSVALFDGYKVPLLALFVGIVGMAVAMFSGMPAMVRSRFATATLGRDRMVGREGTAEGSIDPDGTALVDGGRWSAHTTRVRRIVDGAAVRVVSVEGMILEVEPLEHHESDGGTD
ncbi:MAG: NfeD family protein [Microthrixaceae bacterium]